MMKPDQATRPPAGQEAGPEASAVLLQSYPAPDEPSPSCHATGEPDENEEELTGEIDQQWTELRHAATDADVSWATFSDKVGRLIKTLYKLRYFTR